MKLHQQAAMGACLAGLAFSGLGCSGQSKEPTPVVSTLNFSVVPMEQYAKGQTYADQLNNWIGEHPDLRVTGLSGVLAYREGCQAFVVEHSPNLEAQQSFYQLGSAARYTAPSTWEGVHGVKELQDWADSHPGMTIVAFTSVPAYSGGVRDWVICAEAAQ